MDNKVVDKKTVRLTASQYWEWRTTITEMQLEQEKLKSAKMEHAHLLKDAELWSLRSNLFLKVKLESAQKKNDASVAEYNRFREGLEKTLGTSLNNKVIDDATFEVKDLPPEEQKGI